MIQILTTTKPVSAVEIRGKCPSCNAEGMFGFHRAEGIPVHSCLILQDKTAAANYPVGDLNLGYCPACGFISNMLFNPEVHDYSTNYEETQGFSPRFSSFAESLATTLVNDYSVRRKTVLEIGCGKGEFLTLMCRIGGNIGIGIDPSYMPGRLPEEMTKNIYFIRELFSEQHLELVSEADFICCRHTLEHIAQTAEFLKLLRRGIGENSKSIVFFEVPDVMRVLTQGAFWDIYYEHCSYFTIGSLARLFRNTGFDVLSATLAFKDQYILLAAKPSLGKQAKAADNALDQVDDLPQLMDAVTRFNTVYQSKFEHISQWVRETARNNKIVLWGSGSKAVALLTTLKQDDKIEYVVDINPYRHNKHMPGVSQKIIPPQFLKKYQPDGVIIMNAAYSEEIGAELDSMNLHVPVYILI